MYTNAFSYAILSKSVCEKAEIRLKFYNDVKLDILSITVLILPRLLRTTLSLY